MNQYDQLSLLRAAVGTFKKAATVASKLIFNDSRLLQCEPDRVICILLHIQQHIIIWIILTTNLERLEIADNPLTAPATP